MNNYYELLSIIEQKIRHFVQLWQDVRTLLSKNSATQTKEFLIQMYLKLQ
jgi:hypothetical protein